MVIFPKLVCLGKVKIGFSCLVAGEEGASASHDYLIFNSCLMYILSE